MSLRIFRHTSWHVTVAVGVDSVIGDCPLPSECVQNNVWGECHVINTEADMPDIDEASMYAVQGWVLPVIDPDTATDVNALWDALVPKDADVTAGGFDLNTIGVNAAQFFEEGEINLDAIMGLSNTDPQKRWFRRKKMLSFANTGRQHIAGTPDTFYMTDLFPVRSKKNIMADMISESLLAFATPNLGDIDTARNLPGTEAIWMQLKYVDVVLEQAWMQLVGLTEAGAETPYEDAALAIQDMLEPEPIDDATSFSGVNFVTHTNLTFDITVPGRREISVLSGAA